MFDTMHTPAIGQAVVYNDEVYTVTCLYGVIADAVYGSKNAWVGIQNSNGERYNCSLYEIRPCSFHD